MFRKYMHIERLGKPAVEGILGGKCHIFPKIDGTNASIWLEDGVICAGSRNRELELDADNAGFLKYVLDNGDVFEPFFLRYPYLRLYGEWLVPHTLKSYQDNAWRKFYVFDVYNEDMPLAYSHYSPIMQEFGIEFIPVLAIEDDPSIERLEELARSNKYLVSSGSGEGIVIKNYDFINRFGNTVWAKLVIEQFKEEKYSHDKQIQDGSDESKLVRRFVTRGRVSKIKANMLINGPIEGKRIPELFWRVWGDFISDEIVDIAMSRKYTIDFSKLYRLAVEQTKIWSKELF